MFCQEGYQIHPQAPLSVCSDAFNDLKRKLKLSSKEKERTFWPESVKEKKHYLKCKYYTILWKKAGCCVCIIVAFSLIERKEPFYHEICVFFSKVFFLDSLDWIVGKKSSTLFLFL